jgi:hypothetical protein
MEGNIMGEEVKSLRVNIFELSESFKNEPNIVEPILNYLKNKLSDTGAFVFKTEGETVKEGYINACESSFDLFISLKADFKPKSGSSYAAVKFFKDGDIYIVNLVKKIGSRFKGLEIDNKKAFKEVVMQNDENPLTVPGISSVIISIYAGSDLMLLYENDPDTIVSDIVDSIYFSILEHFELNLDEEVNLREFAD